MKNRKTEKGKFQFQIQFTMEHKYFLSILILRFVHPFEAHPLLLSQTVGMHNFDWMKLIEYPHGQKCLQIVLDGRKDVLKVFMTEMTTPVYVRSEATMKFRNISNDNIGQCETFVIFAKNFEMVNQIFRPNRAKQFFPFTTIYFHLDDRHSVETNANDLSSVRKFLIENAIFGFTFEWNFQSDNKSNVVVRDLLTNSVKRKRRSHFPYELSHPIVDTNLAKDNFRISLFNCPPYTIYPQLESGDEMLVVEFFC